MYLHVHILQIKLSRIGDMRNLCPINRATRNVAPASLGTVHHHTDQGHRHGVRNLACALVIYWPRCQHDGISGIKVSALRGEMMAAFHRLSSGKWRHHAVVAASPAVNEVIC